ncbi:S26 family signal peptidase [Megasphaera massiliensis]|uniref:S26 family signal peptidase n=2 Tax=Megasphaera massiliensis TaxID=1232428 RepID=UPI0030795B88
MYRQARVCWIVLGGILMAGIILTLYIHCFGSLFYTNNTPSAPIGIYMVSPNPILSYGDYVNVHQPVDIPALHSPQGTRLLKQVAGLPGDEYTVSDKSIFIRGKSYPIYNFSYLPHLAPGQYQVPEGQVLLLNPMEYSLDSRYLGPLPKNSIESKVFLLIPLESIARTLNNIYTFVRS